MVAALAEEQGSRGRLTARSAAGFVYDAPTTTEPAGESNATGNGVQAASATEDEESAAPAETVTDSAVAQVLGERAARLNAEREAAAAEVERMREVARGKRKAEREEEEEGQRAGLPPSETKKHADMLRRKKIEEAEARKRIQKMIEDDKAARRADKAQRAAERELERKAALGIADESDLAELDKATSASTTSRPITQGITTDSCALQVRLLDGSSLKQRFPSDNSLKDVRKWIDQDRQDGSHPYTFKLMLTPLPNRTLDVTEEGESLASLGLCPSATLVLHPIEKYSAAYAEATGSPFQRLLAYILAFFTWISSAVSSVLAPVLPSARHTTAPASQLRDVPLQSASSRSTGPQQDARQKDYQLYNGNSVSCVLIPMSVTVEANTPASSTSSRAQKMRMNRQPELPEATMVFVYAIYSVRAHKSGMFSMYCMPMP
jgi:hypothetical protein